MTRPAGTTVVIHPAWQLVRQALLRELARRAITARGRAEPVRLEQARPSVASDGERARGAASPRPQRRPEDDQ